jgi:diamine N-acetyltransferase
MIDERFQGKQLGKSAVTFSQQVARTFGLCGVSLTTMDIEHGNALNLYLALEFEPTGRRLDDEIELMCRNSDM